MKLSTKVDIVSDEKVWKKLQQNLKRESKEIEIGWWNSMHPTGVPVAQVAAWNEEGYYTSGMYQGYHPPRPFMSRDFRKFVEKNMPKYAAYLTSVMQGSMTPSAMNNSIRKDLEDGLKQIIIDFDMPENSDLTVELKGFNDPLIHTGTMYDTVKTRLVSSSRK